MLSRNESLCIKERARRKPPPCREEVIIEVGEFCNKIVTDDKGVWLHFDRCLLESVVDMFKGMGDE